MHTLHPPGIFPATPMTFPCSSPELQTLLNACPDFQADQPPDENLRQASGTFLRAALRDHQLIEQAVGVLDELTPDAISWMALIFGSYVENGGQADTTAPPLIRILRDWCARLPTCTDEDDDLPEPDETQSALLRAVPFLCQSIVGHLGRLPETQTALAQDIALSERLDELGAYSHCFMWVHEALSRWSGPLLILHAASGTGMRLQVRNVSNCFHLFSLIQCAVGQHLPDGQEADADLCAAAHGEDAAGLQDDAWWHYGSPLSSTPELGASIWGEANPRSIPCIDGHRIMLLWPRLLSGRSWDCGFFGPHLEAMPAEVTVEETLPVQACHAWFKKLALPWPKADSQAIVTST